MPPVDWSDSDDADRSDEAGETGEAGEAGEAGETGEAGEQYQDEVEEMIGEPVYLEPRAKPSTKKRPPYVVPPLASQVKRSKPSKPKSERVPRDPIKAAKYRDFNMAFEEYMITKSIDYERRHGTQPINKQRAVNDKIKVTIDFNNLSPTLTDSNAMGSILYERWSALDWDGVSTVALEFVPVYRNLSGRPPTCVFCTAVIENATMTIVENGEKCHAGCYVIRKLSTGA